MKVKLFRSGVGNSATLENEINQFLADSDNGIKVQEIKFGVSFFYDQKEHGYNGGYGALIMYEEKERRSRSRSRYLVL